MSSMIETNPIQGFSVYGVQMVEYTSDGVSGRDYGTAVALASFAQATAIEEETAAFSNVLRARQKKLDDLSDADAIIASVIAKMDPDSPESDDTVTDERLEKAQKLASAYGIDLHVKRTEFQLPQVTFVWFSITREDAENGRANLEYAMDVEDNDMQQDMITLQGLISKRDNSFDTASKVLKKVASTASSIIRSIGQ